MMSVAHVLLPSWRSALGAAGVTLALLLGSCAEVGVPMSASALTPPAPPPAPVATSEAAIVAPPALAPAPAPAPALHVVAGHFELTQPIGAAMRGDQLVGEEFTMGAAKFGIDAVARDPDDPSGEIELYQISTLGADGHSTPYCPANGNQPVMAFPMAGSWSATGRHLHSDNGFSLVCAGTVEARCVQLGYRPWDKTADGKNLWDYHEACVRALRADYCGSGATHSAEHANFSIYDLIGVRKLAAPAGQSFEAAWGPRGAVCVRHVRAPARVTLRDLRTECPNLPKVKLEESCDEREAAQVYTKSRDETPTTTN